MIGISNASLSVALTGANGFVGRFCAPFLMQRGHRVAALTRRRDETLVAHTSYALVSEPAELAELLAGQDVLLHLAGRAHVMKETVSNPLAAYRKANVELTMNLAQAAVEAGVKRFVYVSSIKVNGDRTGEQPFTAGDSVFQSDPYAHSKWEAEQELCALSERTGLEVVIVRPPLIYGPGMKGNLRTLARAIEKGIPLPFASLGGTRDLVALENLCDLLEVCMTHPSAPGNVFLVSDGKPLTTPELIRLMAQSLGKPARLLHCPVWGLKLAGCLTGRTAQIERLTGDLRVDIRATCETLGWYPKVSPRKAMPAAFRHTA